jgi:hypothetical protein
MFWVLPELGHELVTVALLRSVSWPVGSVPTLVVPPRTTVPPSMSPVPVPEWLRRKVRVPLPDLVRPPVPASEPLPSIVKFLLVLLTVSDAGLSAPMTLRVGVFEPESSMVTASPLVKVVGPTSEAKLAVVVSQLFVVPSPTQVTGRGWGAVETIRQHCWVQVSPVVSVTVKRKPARPGLSRAGVKRTIALPGPLWVMVPLVRLETEKTGLEVKPEVNLRRSMSMKLGEAAVFLPTVPWATALKWRYSSRRVYPAGEPVGKNEAAVSGAVRTVL